MSAISLNSLEDKFVISIDKSAIGKQELMQFLDNLRVEFLAKKVNFGEEIEKIGEEITDNWWKENKDRFIPINEQ